MWLLRLWNDATLAIVVWQTKERALQHKVERLTQEVKRQEQDFVSTVNALTQQVVRETRSRVCFASFRCCVLLT